LLGLAHEASLKMLELTDGNVFTSYDSPLGFRHGPKAIIRDQTLIVMFLSNDPYTRQYDIDMLKELAKEKTYTGFHILVISDEWDEELKNYADYYFFLTKKADENQSLADVYLSFPYIFFAQILAVSKSLNLGFSPDNPSANGSVNRVVQGVTIYPFE
jgi:tagatose-6-phosphate ketose/aldose isomerase